MEMRLTISSIEIIQSLMICGLDSEEIREWLLMKNKAFEGRSPLYLINRGRAERVLQFTLEAEENPSLVKEFEDDDT
ncbi:MAG: DUF2384 domain-containing protein [Anaerolineaceae bacterium]|nr:MAG: DUF2384 domain-containing protein [Anaerolineaceae bacterium]